MQWKEQLGVTPRFKPSLRLPDAWSIYNQLRLSFLIARIGVKAGQGFIRSSVLIKWNFTLSSSRSLEFEPLEFIYLLFQPPNPLEILSL